MNYRKFFSLAAVVVLAAFDQWFKHLIVTGMAEYSSVGIVPGFLNFTYVRNDGAAFSILKEQRVFLICITSIVLIFILIMIIINVINQPLLLSGASLIIAGGLGNLIDRISKGYVIDYLDISPLFNFAIFNFADCCVVSGTILTLIYLIFQDSGFRKNG